MMGMRPSPQPMSQTTSSRVTAASSNIPGIHSPGVPSQGARDGVPGTQNLSGWLSSHSSSASTSSSVPHAATGAAGAPPASPPAVACPWKRAATAFPCGGGSWRTRRASSASTPSSAEARGLASPPPWSDDILIPL